MSSGLLDRPLGTLQSESMLDMADPFVSLEYDDRDVLDRLQRLRDKAGDLQPALREIGEEGLRFVEEGFETETDPFGNPWQPLSAFTISWKKRNNRILKILQSSGRLRASINYQVSDDQVVIGTNVSYAYKPQLGVGQPQRQFLGIGPAFKEAIVQILEDYLLQEE